MEPAKQVPGEVTVTLLSGKDLKDCDWFKKQDPYVVLICGNQKFRSNTHSAGGVTPKWDQTFTFRVDQETEMELTVWDEDNIKDDCIGKAKVQLVSIRTNPGKVEEKEVPLIRRVSRRQQGHVLIRLKFTPTPAPGPLPHPGLDTISNGLSSVGSLPDFVPRYEPTCGLIQPNPNQLLPCHKNNDQPPVSGLYVAVGAGTHYPAYAPTANTAFAPPLPQHTNSFSQPSHPNVYPHPLMYSYSGVTQSNAPQDNYPAINTASSAPPLTGNAPPAFHPYHQPPPMSGPYNHPGYSPYPNC